MRFGLVAQVSTILWHGQKPILHSLPDRMPTGVVKKFFDDKGFGFITPDDGSDDVFVHRLCAGDDRSAYLEEGDKVTYDVGA